MLLAACPMVTLTPSRRNCSISGVALMSEPRDALAAREQDARDRTHADAADADEMVRHRSLFPHVSDSTRARIAASGSSSGKPACAAHEAAPAVACCVTSASTLGKAARRKLAIGKNDRRSGSRDRLRVCVLMRLGRERIRHQDCRHPQRRQLGQRRGSRPREDQVGDRVRVAASRRGRHARRTPASLPTAARTARSPLASPVSAQHLPARRQLAVRPARPPRASLIARAPWLPPTARSVGRAGSSPSRAAARRAGAARAVASARESPCCGTSRGSPARSRRRRPRSRRPAAPAAGS